MATIRLPARSVLVSAVLLVGGCARDWEADPPAYLLAEPTWVGVASCERCHQEATERWRGSHHDLAMQEATPETVLGDFDDASFTWHGVTSGFERRGEEFWVRTDGPDGKLADYRVAYVFGVTPLQQYLIEFPGGRLQTLSLCWDSRPAEMGGQRWFHLYPGEPIRSDDELHWTGASQNWNYMCAECHSTDLRKNYDPRTDSYSTSWEEIDVSCEACHGPASRHVAWAQAVERGEPAPEDAGTGLVVRLRDLDDPYWSFDDRGIARRTPRRSSHTQVEACGRCHSRRSVSRDPYVYDRPLLDTHRLSLLEPTLYHADGQILDEVYVYGSFVQSRMHAEGVTCSDCHDPHSLEPIREGDALCAACHLPAKYEAVEHHHHEKSKEGSRCVDCHMRFENYMVVDPRHDHSFRVPRPDLSAELDTPDACTDCHADKGLDWSVEAFTEWYPERVGTPHYGQALHAGRTASLDAPRLLAELIVDEGQPGIVRATAMGLYADYATVGSAVMVESTATDPDPLVRLGATRFLPFLNPEARTKISVGLLQDPILIVRTEAARALLSVPRAQLEPAEWEAMEPALEDLRATHRVNLDRPESRLVLGAIHTQLGEMGEARAEYERALELDPTSTVALINLADLERSIGNERQAGERLRQALEVDPNDADAHHARGLWLVRQGRLAEALPELRRATELAPESPHYAFVRAVAMWSAGDREGALSVLERSQAKRPADRGTLLTLVAYHLEAGSREAAERYGRILLDVYPRDPEVLQMRVRLFGPEAVS